MTIVKWIFALGVGGFLIFMGAMKFSGGAHIFPFIEYKATTAGLPFAEIAFPLGNWATGGLELVAGLLLIMPMTRKLGSHLAVLPFLGAVAFHLSPVLGVVTPDGYADPKPIEALAAGGPFAATDFSVSESNALFMMAFAGLVAAAINFVIQKK